MIAPGDIVVIRAGDDWPEHLFRVEEVWEDCVGGVALTGPLAGAYGQPEYDQIAEVVGREVP